MNNNTGVKRLEIIAYSIEACEIALSAGADRIELCDNPGDGGTTPSFGLVSKALEISSIPVFPMVRPRGGDFLYSEWEIDIMLKDIRLFRELGCKGVVFGLLNPDGTVDENHTKQLVEASGDMEVTFHRAFDRVSDPMIALQSVIRCGCKRILTSGGYPTAPEGMDMIRRLQLEANDRIIIMPGSGVRASNINNLMHFTGCVEVHSSASVSSAGRMSYVNKRMREHLTYPLPDPEQVKAMKANL
jgi:copper homeostasis protein